MKSNITRTTLQVIRHDGAWVVELEGEHFGHSHDKEIAKASAYKRARQMLDSGSACQVRVHGEHGFYGA